MKLYQTYSNDDVQRNNLYRVSILELGIVRWSYEKLRHTVKSVPSWGYSSIPIGTTTPNFWSVK